MPRISDIQVVKRTEQPILSIRTITRMEELPNLIGSSYGKLARYVESIGETPADVPFTAYHNHDMQKLDVEIGFLMPERVAGSGDIQATAIPAGLFIFCMHQGSYAETCKAYEEMLDFTVKNRFEINGAYYEYYYNGPNYPEDKLLTRLVLPVRKI